MDKILKYKQVYFFLPKTYDEEVRVWKTCEVYNTPKDCTHCRIEG